MDVCRGATFPAFSLGLRGNCGRWHRQRGDQTLRARPGRRPERRPPRRVELEAPPKSRATARNGSVTTVASAAPI
ncbi:hypothetical protein E5671_38340 [Streptomyces sp. BA2]|nr:hypothetical protein [Streptomyces sp. BA2]